MPRRPRSKSGGTYFHAVNRSIRRAPLFARSSDYRAFLQVLAAGVQRYPMHVLSFCVLSNHWHLVVGPTGTTVLSAFMQWVTATHAIRWHRHRKSVGQGPVYQGRFRSEVIDSAADLVKVSLQSAEKLQNQQLVVIRSALDQQSKAISELGQAKTIDELLALQTKMAGAQWERAMGFWTELAQTQMAQARDWMSEAAHAARANASVRQASRQERKAA